MATSSVHGGEKTVEMRGVGSIQFVSLNGPTVSEIEASGTQII
jgi:hypothetical protein